MKILNFLIATDSSCDLPSSYVDANDIYVFPISVTINNKEILDDLGKSYSHQDFYNTIREGSMPTTSQVNMFTFKEQFIKWASDNIPVLYLAFSSGLSGTYNSALAARLEVLEEYPDANITIIDTLAASGGVGLLVYYANEMRNSGKSLEEIAEFITITRLNLTHVFTVDDLYHLERGGRISHASAFVGSLLQIKPVLYVSDEGTLIPFQKMRGRKKALRALVSQFEKSCIDKTAPILITHGDCVEDAEFVAELIRESYDVKKIIINTIGPAIGSHSGANTVALFFIGLHKIPLE